MKLLVDVCLCVFPWGPLSVERAPEPGRDARGAGIAELRAAIDREASGRTEAAGRESSEGMTGPSNPPQHFRLRC